MKRSFALKPDGLSRISPTILSRFRSNLCIYGQTMAFRLLFALAAHHYLHIERLDIVTAFLNGLIINSSMSTCRKDMTQLAWCVG